MTVVAPTTTIRNRRRSTMSANAPAGMAKRNTGKFPATCTSATINGSGLRLVMSHPDAALYIQVPMLETTVAVQRTLKVGCRNGAQGELASTGLGERETSVPFG